MSLQWGPLTKDDAVPLAELWAAMEAEDDTGERYGVEDVAQQLANPLLDLPGGTLAARRGRSLVAFAMLPARPAYLRMWGGVHPAHRGQGYGTRLLDWGYRTARAMRVRNESFQDHWRSVPYTRESWLQYMIGNLHFLPGSSFLALADGRPVSAVITHEREGQAWIQIVGTLAGWRGRGVASGLLAHALSAFKAQGYGTAGLGVDTHNPTGALSVYRRAGFEVVRRSATYARALTPE
ncbi:GNAT family N-acetyltransferase [Nonomuraea sediminis]|uniref:GNAT family N-acetyltransferase n=1 Tax=Nonomuraea sediminis TaxID=2835864 RepID=UPI001BDCFE7D|nr:GNAT family N-acetyltransferase [Nonomuraea sediminis]